MTDFVNQIILCFIPFIFSSIIFLLNFAFLNVSTYIIIHTFSVGVDSVELMGRAIDLIVLCAQMNEHFSFMYAELCKKITDKWSSGTADEVSMCSPPVRLLVNATGLHIHSPINYFPVQFNATFPFLMTLFRSLPSHISSHTYIGIAVRSNSTRH